MSHSIGVVYFDGGTAHRTTAFALVAAINRAAGAERAEVVDALDVFEPVPMVHGLISRGLTTFNYLLRTERLIALDPLMRMARVLFELQSTRRTFERMSPFFRERPYDVLVSTIPYYNEMLFSSLRVVRPDAASVVVPVDFVEPVPRFWFSPRSGADAYLCSTDALMEQARAGAPRAQRHRLGGMIVHPDCYLDDPAERARERDAIGVRADRPIGLVSFGGQGSSLMVPIAEQLDLVDRDLSVLYVCGRDERTFQTLEAMKTRHDKRVIGFTTQMPRLLRAADFFIGKPGPISIHEAIVTRTPPIVFRSRGMKRLLGPNERWIEQEGIGILAPDIAATAESVRKLLDDPSYAERVAKAGHRGVFEAADIVMELAKR